MRILLSVCLVLLFLCGVRAAETSTNSYTVRWYGNHPTNGAPVEAGYHVKQFPRVNLDLSVDGGRTFPYPIARGVPGSYDLTNSYDWGALPYGADIISETALVRAQSLRGAGEVQLLSEYTATSGIFTVAGIWIFTPEVNASVPITGGGVIRWKAAGAGEQVQVMLSPADTPNQWQPIAVLDCVPGTNTWEWFPSGEGIEAPGRVVMAIQSMSDSRVLNMAGPFTIAP